MCFKGTLSLRKKLLTKGDFEEEFRNPTNYKALQKPKKLRSSTKSLQTTKLYKNSTNYEALQKPYKLRSSTKTLQTAKLYKTLQTVKLYKNPTNSEA
jgi:hypothetical protein